MEDIGKKIRKLREERGWSQQELANKVGYKSRASINKLETERDIPIKKLVPIAEAFGIAPSVFMGWEEEKKEFDIEFEEDHIELIELYSKLTKEQKQVVMNLLRSFVN